MPVFIWFYHRSVSFTDEKKPARMSLHLIVKRQLPPDAENWGHEKIVSELNRITHLRLDRERIKEIDGLELLGGSVTNIYLQVNNIERIGNLDCCKNLSFLALSNNRIRKVENLTCLKKLLFLDLSENRIKDLDVEELPESVVILNLKGNPCTETDSYRARIIRHLPRLKQLDLLEVTKEERSAAGVRESSDEEEDDEDDQQFGAQGHGDNGHGKSENFHTTATGMMIRSQKRCEDNLKTHKKHNQELDDLRLSWNVPASSRSPDEVRGSLSQRSSKSQPQITGSASNR